MSVIDKGKTIEILMSDNDCLKVRSNNEKGETLIIQCQKNKLIISKPNSDGTIIMDIPLSNGAICNKEE